MDEALEKVGPHEDEVLPTREPPLAAQSSETPIIVTETANPV